MKPGGAGEAVLLQLAFNQADGQGSAIHGNVQLFQQIGYRANVVLMAVGDDRALDFGPVFLHKAKVRNHQIHARHVLVRKGQAAVHNDHVILALVEGKVFPNLVEPAQKVSPNGGLLGFAGPAPAPAGGGGRRFGPARLNRRLLGGRDGGRTQRLPLGLSGGLLAGPALGSGLFLHGLWPGDFPDFWGFRRIG